MTTPPRADVLPTSVASALRGRFVAFEGPDGSGKSTQLKRFVEAARAAGVALTCVREPGGTAVGEAIRQVLLSPQSEMTIRCEMLLYMASRNQLVEERIRPALARGELVVADRFLSSTHAYQGAAGGVPAAEIDAVARVATGGLQPDLVVLFDVDQATAARRTKGEAKGEAKTTRRRTGTGRGSAGAAGSAGAMGRVGSVGAVGAVGGQGSLFADRIESRDESFHERVRRSYLEQARGDPGRHLVIDASRGPDEVWEALVAGLGPALAQGA